MQALHIIKNYESLALTSFFHNETRSVMHRSIPSATAPNDIVPE